MTIVALHGGAWTTRRQTDCWFEAFQNIIYMGTTNPPSQFLSDKPQILMAGHLQS